MYESPINIEYGEQIYRNVQDQLENKVFEMLQTVNINVNRSELIRALRYDRDQYDKGYADGFAAGMARAIRDDEDD